MSSNSKPHAAILSSPGMGHLIPVLELGKRLVTHLNFTVTIFATASQASPAESQSLQSAMTPKLCDIVQLPPVDVSSLLHPQAAVVTQLAVMMREIRPFLRSAIAAMTTSRPTMLIVDTFGTASLPIADEFGIPKYVYIASNAWFLALTVYTPTLDKEVNGEYVDQIEPLRIPGCKLVRPHDVVDPMLNRTNQQYVEYIRIGVEIPLSDGVLVNTWQELQPTPLAALKDESLLGEVVNRVPVYPIGPLIRAVQPAGATPDQEHLLDWLDKQPSESVIFVSLGSGGTLSLEQMTEMARGLELSQQRFIWVVRHPTVKSADAAFFTSGKGGDYDDPSTHLPNGFITRTRDMGQVVPLWAPQVDILSHKAVGGFLSHCGWNSTLESIINGVPMIVWPLYAEQRMNATLLAEELGVAVRSEVAPWKEVVGREEIERMVRKIMVEEDGYTIRRRVKELKVSGLKALSEGGSSLNALSQWKKQCDLACIK